MKTFSLLAALWLAAACCASADAARVWTDVTGQYTLEADLVAFNDRTVVLQRADHELAAVPIDQLSAPDREYLKSMEAADAARGFSDGPQTWTLRDGTKIVGRIVDFARTQMSIQRRRGRIYVNDRPLENLPEFYQQLVPQIVAHFENLNRSDRQALETWLVRQRGARRAFDLQGVIFETENHDEYGVPFFMLSDDDARLLKADWDEWLAADDGNDYVALDNHAFLLRSLAAARQRDAQVQREIAIMQLQLQAVQAGLTSLWEVTLHPTAGQGGPPRWVVVPGRDSRQATAAALELHGGYVAGPVRRVSGGR